MAVAREHATVERVRTIESKLKTLEAQMVSFKQVKSQLVATLEIEKAKTEAVQEELDRYILKIYEQAHLQLVTVTVDFIINWVDIYCMYNVEVV